MHYEDGSKPPNITWNALLSIWAEYLLGIYFATEQYQKNLAWAKGDLTGVGL